MKLRSRWSTVIIICVVIVLVILTVVLSPSSFEKSVHTFMGDLVYSEKELINIEMPSISSIFNHPAPIDNLWIKVATTVLVRDCHIAFVNVVMSTETHIV